MLVSMRRPQLMSTASTCLVRSERRAGGTEARFSGSRCNFVEQQKVIVKIQKAIIFFIYYSYYMQFLK